MNVKTCAIYARISVSDVRIPKTEIQIKQLKELASARGYDVVDVYEDDGISAAKAEARPDFDRLMTDLQAGKFQVILATEEARLARNMTEKLLLQTVCTSVGATWETIRDGSVDPSTASGEFMAIIRGAVDSFESKRKAERMRSANFENRILGKPVLGQRPFGWEIDQTTPRPEEQDLIRQGIKMVLSGEKPYAIAKAWNDSGIKTGRGNDWKRQSVVSVLTRWRNAGWTTHDDEPVAEAVWDPICTRDDLENVRAILSHRVSATGWTKPAGLCSGVAKCVCGEHLVLTGNRQWGKNYRCSSVLKPGGGVGKHVSIRMNTLDAKVTEAIVEEYFLRNEPDSDPQAEALGKLHNRLAELAQQKDRVLDLYAEGAITKAEFSRKASQIDSEASKLRNQVEVAANESAHSALILEASNMVRAAFEESGSPALQRKHTKVIRQRLTEAFEALSLEQKRGLVATSLAITVNPGREASRIDIERL